MTTNAVAPSQNSADLAAAIGVARFFRSAADRIKAHDDLSQRIADAKRRITHELDPVTDTEPWVAAVVELVDLVVEYHSR